jgi:hypothetical protein
MRIPVRLDGGGIEGFGEFGHIGAALNGPLAKRLAARAYSRNFLRDLPLDDFGELRIEPFGEHGF